MARRRDGAVAAALALHAWAGEVLFDDATHAPPAADAAAWRVFLRADGCALPLGQRLEALGITPTLPTAVAETLARQAALEMSRTLSAHRQLRLIAEIARAQAMPIVVLKGGVSVAAGRPLELKDLDVLPAPGRAHELAAALDARGYDPLHDDTATRDTAGAAHLTARITTGAIRIEIHEWLVGLADPSELVARAEPLPGHSSLLRLGAADHLWYVLHHAAIQHPERRGRLRDRLLMRDAAMACTVKDLAIVQARIAASSRQAMLRGMLATALPHGTASPDALGTSERTAFAAACDAAVAARLVLLTRFPTYRQRPYFRHVVDNALALVSTERSWSTEMLDARADERRMPSVFRPVAWAEARIPWIARPVRYTLIGVRGLLAAPVAAYAVAGGRRAVRIVRLSPRSVAP